MNIVVIIIIIIIIVKMHSLYISTHNSTKNLQKQCGPKENFPPRNQSKSSEFTHRKERSQLICNANQLTGI